MCILISLHMFRSHETDWLIINNRWSIVVVFFWLDIIPLRRIKSSCFLKNIHSLSKRKKQKYYNTQGESETHVLACVQVILTLKVTYLKNEFT